MTELLRIRHRLRVTQNSMETIFNLLIIHQNQKVRNPFALIQWLRNGKGPKYTPAEIRYRAKVQEQWKKFLEIRLEIRRVAEEVAVMKGVSVQLFVEKLAPLASDKPSHGVDPFRRIPNMGKFKLGVKLDNDPLFAQYGIDLVVRGQNEFEPYVNKQANRYIDHQVRRLQDARTSPALYWRIVSTLLRRSSVFLVTAINHCFPQWHRKRRFAYICEVIQGYQALVKSDARHIDYERVYIPKGLSQVRPLGVPGPSWRVYLHLLNQFLTIYLSQFHHPSQHGFWPRKGTLTAWEEVLQTVIHQPNIVEFDLKSFFDSVDLDFLKTLLGFYGMPKDWVERFDALQRSVCKLPSDLIAPLPAFASSSAHKAVQGMWSKWGRLFNQNVEVISKVMNRKQGVPQGSPTSPLLSSCVLTETILYDYQAVMYADDGLIYGKKNGLEVSLEEVLARARSEWNRVGISVHPGKSFQVKKDGIWLRPLKFLGLTYDGQKDELRASTRNGADLVFDKKDLILAIRAQAAVREDRRLSETHGEPGKHVSSIRQKRAPEFTWELLVRSHVFGLIQSRMYSNRWNLPDPMSDTRMNSRRGSWASRYHGITGLNIYNSSSVASTGLINAIKLGDLSLAYKLNAELLVKHDDDH